MSLLVVAANSTPEVPVGWSFWDVVSLSLHVALWTSLVVIYTRRRQTRRRFARSAYRWAIRVGKSNAQARLLSSSAEAASGVAHLIYGKSLLRIVGASVVLSVLYTGTVLYIGVSHFIVTPELRATFEEVQDDASPVLASVSETMLEEAFARIGTGRFTTPTRFSGSTEITEYMHGDDELAQPGVTWGEIRAAKKSFNVDLQETLSQHPDGVMLALLVNLDGTRYGPPAWRQTVPSIIFLNLVFDVACAIVLLATVRHLEAKATPVRVRKPSAHDISALHRSWHRLLWLLLGVFTVAFLLVLLPYRHVMLGNVFAFGPLTAFLWSGAAFVILSLIISAFHASDAVGEEKGSWAFAVLGTPALICAGWAVWNALRVLWAILVGIVSVIMNPASLLTPIGDYGFVPIMLAASCFIPLVVFVSVSLVTLVIYHIGTGVQRAVYWIARIALSSGTPIVLFVLMLLKDASDASELIESLLFGGPG
ncbi:MAG: hypothetical protein AAFX05_03065 [Planctomycetota bacterium]